jgi:hypothetical protein
VDRLLDMCRTTVNVTGDRSWRHASIAAKEGASRQRRWRCSRSTRNRREVRVRRKRKGGTSSRPVLQSRCSPVAHAPGSPKPTCPFSLSRSTCRGCGCGRGP